MHGLGLWSGIWYSLRDMYSWKEADFVNDNEGDGVADNADDSNDWKKYSLQDPGDHQKLLFSNVP